MKERLMERVKLHGSESAEGKTNNGLIPMLYLSQLQNAVRGRKSMNRKSLFIAFQASEILTWM